MGTQNGRSLRNEKAEKLSVPPGFVSLSSFTLKSILNSDAACTSMAVGSVREVEPSSMGSTPSIIDIENFKSNLGHRPWILHNQLAYNPKESDAELELDFPLTSCLPKGVMRGCPSCPDCLKVIARWHPEESHRPVLEEAPVFHPSEGEFKDVLKYVASIRQEAERFGMCRIVPPPSWQPPCLITEKNVWEASKFHTHIQLVNQLQDQCLRKILDRIPEEIKTKRRKVWMRSSEDRSFGGCCTDSKEAQCHAESFVSKLGPEFTPKAFKKHADDFKRQYFCENDKALNSNSNLRGQEGWEPSVENVEGEYWRIIENPSEEIEVLSGANIETGVFGSGFPVNSNSTGKPNYPKYLESGWNLNNIFKLPGSLLCFDNCGISATLLPRLFTGMCFSSVCWKVEEHHLYSLTYMHLGSPKIWYAIPGRYCYKFERVVKKHLPQFLEHPELLYKNIYQLSPSTLTAEGIPVYRCMQHPGEFVLTFPASYHSQFDCGFNCSETVNFAPFDWLPYGQHVIEMYSDQGRKTSVSHDKLLLGAATEAVEAQWQLLMLKRKLLDAIPCKSVRGKDEILAKAVKLRVKQEAIRREYLCKFLESRKMEDDFDIHTKRECSICLYDLHFSAIGCSCSPDRYACLRHAKYLCSCSWTSKCLLFRYEIKELKVLVEALDGKLDAICTWAKENLGLRMDSDDLIHLTNHGQVSASLNAAATSALSPGLKPGVCVGTNEPMIGQSSRIEEKENDVLLKMTPSSCSWHDIVKPVDPKLGNLTSEKRKFERSLSVQSDVIILSDDEDV